MKAIRVRAFYLAIAGTCDLGINFAFVFMKYTALKFRTLLLYLPAIIVDHPNNDKNENASKQEQKDGGHL